MISRRHLLNGLLGCTAMTVLGTTSPTVARELGRGNRRPNIITLVLDDMGYSDFGCFGAEIRTPNIDALAKRGLRYNHFDTKAVCSATRAALMTGRNCHTVNMPDVPDVVAVNAKAYPANAFDIPHNAENIAQALKKVGYATWAVGKWHLIPMSQLGENTGRDSWPLQRGFDYFYGFPRGWTDQYHPELVENNSYIHPQLSADYHLSSDLADKSIALVDAHLKTSPDLPFYLNLAFGTAHAPIQVPHEYADRYDEIYAAGWDRIREGRFARMKELGIIPAETVLPQRGADDRAWTELTVDEKVVFARFMAVYAGFIEHCDEQIGRVMRHLTFRGLDDNTIVVVLSDNGAASEAGQTGVFDGLYRPNRLTPAEERARLAELGTAKTQAEYPRPWGMASSTPLRRYKLWPYSGGTRTPLILVWPGRVRDPGAIRHQFVDVVDIAPTLLEAAGTAFANQVGGTAQLPVAGRSFASTVTNGSAPPVRTTQYFELRGNRAITAGRWRAVAMHQCGESFENDEWRLFNLDQDFSESHDLAGAQAAKLQELKQLWLKEWRAYSPQPLSEPPSIICAMVKGQAPGARRAPDNGG